MAQCWWTKDGLQKRQDAAGWIAPEVIARKGVELPREEGATQMYLF